MSETLQYLKTHSLDDLTKEYSIKCRTYPNNVAILTYSQIDSPKFHPIVRECRGLIIDYKELSIISKPLTRFFNLNEDPNDEFNPDSIARIEEKVDGTLIEVYYHDNEWNIATKGSAYAEGITNGISFRNLFISIIEMNINKFMESQNKNYTYVFELCTLLNKVVKVYKKPVIYLLAIFDKMTEQELPHYYVKYISTLLDVEMPIIYDMKFTDVIPSFESFSATDEGYVLIDTKNNRIKVKNPAYVNLHHLKGNGLNTKRIVDIIFTNETKEVLSYFPEFSDYFAPYQKAFNNLNEEIFNIYEKLSTLNLSQKEYAFAIKDLFFKGVLFSLRKGLTLTEIYSTLSLNNKVKLLETMKKGEQNEQ
jgi:hypothetical protein